MSSFEYRTPQGLTAEELATRDSRRHQIGEMMLDGKWKGSGSRRALSDHWGIPLAEVYRLEGEAAGAIRLARKPGWEDYVEAKLHELDEWIAVCRTTVKVLVVKGEPIEYPQPSIAAALLAIKTQLEVMGALKRPGDKVPAGANPDEYGAMSHEERARLHEEAAQEERRAAQAAKEQRH